VPFSAKTSKLHRARSSRRALLKSLAANVILERRIKTTEAKAKSVKPFLERLVTIARRNTVNSRRRIARFLPTRAAEILAHDIAPRYLERPGGYTRIIKIGPRQSDNSRMVFLEFVE